MGINSTLAQFLHLKKRQEIDALVAERRTWAAELALSKNGSNLPLCIHVLIYKTAILNRRIVPNVFISALLYKGFLADLDYPGLLPFFFTATLVSGAAAEILEHDIRDSAGPACLEDAQRYLMRQGVPNWRESNDDFGLRIMPSLSPNSAFAVNATHIHVQTSSGTPILRNVFIQLDPGSI